ncbi:hypothetical protein HID58_009695 [Brassica napus]|uniref:Uncharacterized protein n=1 Tax=Brassica napus TaxID=3708 RepID=A0ABQ8DTD3_BRANA|nr:hypothetical protein HID58_009695 [Brassica napus]
MKVILINHPLTTWPGMMKSRTRLWTTLIGYSKTVTYSRNVYTFGGGLTAADLSRVRAEKKQKEKEAKEKNDRETGHGGSLETDACDVGEATKTTLRTLLLALLNQNIEDVVLSGRTVVPADVNAAVSRSSVPSSLLTCVIWIVQVRFKRGDLAYEQRAVCMISNSTSAAELNLEKEYEEVGAEGGDDEDDKGEEY